MNVTCDKCESKFKIADDKIPPGRTVSLTCPKCKNKISVSADQDPAAILDDVFAFDEAEDPALSEDPAPSDDVSYDATDKPFDFAEEEGKTALLCEANSEVRKKISSVLGFMEYHITEAENTRDALKKFRFHVYDLVILNENFDTRMPDSNGILIYFARAHMAARRNMYVVLLSNRFRTMDNMVTLQKSVNLVINLKDIEDIEKILKRGISEYEFTYRIYQESLKNAGRI
jgi:predicted Zn finger-like uncharacterized protein